MSRGLVYNVWWPCRSETCLVVNHKPRWEWKLTIKQNPHRLKVKKKGSISTCGLIFCTSSKWNETCSPFIVVHLLEYFLKAAVTQPCTSIVNLQALAPRRWWMKSTGEITSLSNLTKLATPCRPAAGFIPGEENTAVISTNQEEAEQHGLLSINPGEYLGPGDLVRLSATFSRALSKSYRLCDTRTAWLLIHLSWGAETSCCDSVWWQNSNIWWQFVMTEHMLKTVTSLHYTQGFPFLVCNALEGLES